MHKKLHDKTFTQPNILHIFGLLGALFISKESKKNRKVK
jgi:hypothetical protein